jgi:hypothetical protein
MRGLFGLAASALAGLAAIVANQDGDPSIVPFFIGLMFLGAVAAWATHPPYGGMRRTIARGVALIWLVAAVWVGMLLAIDKLIGGDGPIPAPEATYLGLTATVYHLVGLYGGLPLVLAGAFGAIERWIDGVGWRGDRGGS